MTAPDDRSRPGEDGFGNSSNGWTTQEQNTSQGHHIATEAQAYLASEEAERKAIVSLMA
jgi:hypothetical protein